MRALPCSGRPVGMLDSLAARVAEAIPLKLMDVRPVAGE